MKTLLLSLIATATILSSTFAQAASDLVPSIKGKIHNYTSIPSNELKIRVELNCSYTSGFVWPETKSCGNEEQYVQVQADGTYVLPAMKWQKKGSISNYRFSYAVRTNTNHETKAYVSFHATEIKKAPTALAEISLYERPTINVNVATPTGEDYATWRGVINHPSDSVKDPCVRLIYLLVVEAGHSIQDEYEIRESTTDKEVAGKLPSVFFATKGNTGKDLKVSGQLYYETSKPTCEVNTDTVKFDSAVEATGSISEVNKIFNNSTYKVD